MLVWKKMGATMRDIRVYRDAESGDIWLYEPHKTYPYTKAGGTGMRLTESEQQDRLSLEPYVHDDETTVLYAGDAPVMSSGPASPQPVVMPDPNLLTYASDGNHDIVRISLPGDRPRNYTRPCGQALWKAESFAPVQGWTIVDRYERFTGEPLGAEAAAWIRGDK